MCPNPRRRDRARSLVRIRRVGICGTDYSGYLGKMPFFSYPRIPGHELGVEVEAVGAGVSGSGPATVVPWSRISTASAAPRAAGAIPTAASTTRPWG